MLRAIAGGLIKREDIDPRDTRSLAFTHLLLKVQLRREEKEFQQLVWFRDMLVSIDPHLTSDGHAEARKREFDSFQHLIKLVQDSDGDQEDYEEKMKSALRTGWQRSFGDLSKPETQENINKVAEGLRKMRLKNAARLRRPER